MNSIRRKDTTRQSGGLSRRRLRCPGRTPSASAGWGSPAAQQKGGMYRVSDAAMVAESTPGGRRTTPVANSVIMPTNKPNMTHRPLLISLDLVHPRPLCRTAGARECGRAGKDCTALGAARTHPASLMSLFAACTLKNLVSSLAFSRWNSRDTGLVLWGVPPPRRSERLGWRTAETAAPRDHQELAPTHVVLLVCCVSLTAACRRSGRRCLVVSQGPGSVRVCFYRLHARSSPRSHCHAA
jgi:hypothetical protein